jgi:hypothetical protein
LASDLSQADRIKHNRIGEQARPPRDLIPPVEVPGCHRSAFGLGGPFTGAGAALSAICGGSKGAA